MLLFAKLVRIFQLMTEKETDEEKEKKYGLMISRGIDLSTPNVMKSNPALPGGAESVLGFFDITPLWVQNFCAALRQRYREKLKEDMEFVPDASCEGGIKFRKYPGGNGIKVIRFAPSYDYGHKMGHWRPNYDYKTDPQDVAMNEWVNRPPGPDEVLYRINQHEMVAKNADAPDWTQAELLVFAECFKTFGLEVRIFKFTFLMK